MPSDDRGTDRSGRPGGSPRAPRRRPSRATIWRRRITVLVALLVVLALIGWGVWALAQALFGGDDAPDAPATESASESTSESASESASGPAPGGDPVPCAADALELSMSHDARYAGVPSTFVVDLANTGGTDCLVDAGGANLVVEVTSGNDPVWTSAHCPAEEERMLLLGPDGDAQAEVPWPGTRSAADCPEEAPAVQPGTYRARLLLDGVEIAGASSTFTLEEAPPEETPSDGETPTDGEAGSAEPEQG